MSTEVSALGAPRLTSIPAAAERRRDRWFFTGMAAAIVFTVFLGFAESYYLKGYFGSPALSGLLHVHGILFTGWVLLFLAQTTLVAARRTHIHRRLGPIGGALAVLMLVVGYMVAIEGARRGLSPTGDMSPLAFLAVPMGSLLVFAGFVGTGLALRRRSETHKRLMLLATIALVTPALARLPFIGPGRPALLATSLFVVACMLYDRAAHRRVHPAFLWGGLFLILSMPLRLAVSGTGAWHSFARWIIA